MTIERLAKVSNMSVRGRHLTVILVQDVVRHGSVERVHPHFDDPASCTESWALNADSGHVRLNEEKSSLAHGEKLILMDSSTSNSPAMLGWPCGPEPAPCMPPRGAGAPRPRPRPRPRSPPPRSPPPRGGRWPRVPEALGGMIAADKQSEGRRWSWFRIKRESVRVEI